MQARRGEMHCPWRVRKNNETIWKPESFFLYSHGCISKWYQSKSGLLLPPWPLITQLGNGVKSSAWYRKFSMRYHSIHCHYVFLWSSWSHYCLKSFTGSLLPVERWFRLSLPSKVLLIWFQHFVEPWLDCVHAAGVAPPRTASGSSLGTNRSVGKVLRSGRIPWPGRGEVPTLPYPPLPGSWTFQLGLLTPKCCLLSLLPSIQPSYQSTIRLSQPFRHFTPFRHCTTLQTLQTGPLPSPGPFTLRGSLTAPPFPITILDH